MWNNLTRVNNCESYHRSFCALIKHPYLYDAKACTVVKYYVSLTHVIFQSKVSLTAVCDGLKTQKQHYLINSIKLFYTL